MKATIIGAGSTYTPELIEGFINKRDSLNFQNFSLYDINREKLDIVGGLAERMLHSKGFKGKIILTMDPDEAISGADYVFAQIRVGGMEARIRDEKLPLKYGLLGQETTGIGGFLKALRTIPVMMDYARRIEKLAPDAWLINFSNPSGIMAEALLNNTKVKMFGLCNSFINIHAHIAKTIGAKDFDYTYLGLNHLAWFTSVKHGGKEYIRELGLEALAKMKNTTGVETDEELFNAVPGICSSYLNYFYRREEMVKKCQGEKKSRGEVCVDLEAFLFEKYKSKDLSVKPEELAQRGGALYSTAAISAVDAIENDKNEFHAVNVQNKGALPFMQDSDVIETKCLVNRKGALPVAVKNFDNIYIIGLMQAVKAYEKLTVKAALNGSRPDALAALMVHPLIGSFTKAKAAMDEMFEANADYLPAGLLKK